MKGDQRDREGERERERERDGVRQTECLYLIHVYTHCA